MSSLELALTIVTGLVTAGGVAWWSVAHTHSDLVPRSELELLITMMRSHQESTLRELTQLREAIDRLGTRRS